MDILGGAAKFLFGGGVVGLLGKALGIGGKKAPVQALPQATRDDARAQMDANDELRRRKGAAADMITGTRGAEAAGSTGKLVLGN